MLISIIRLYLFTFYWFCNGKALQRKGAFPLTRRWQSHVLAVLLNVVLATGSPCGEAISSPRCWSTSKMFHCTCHSPGNTWSLPDRSPTLCFSHWHSSLSSPWSLTRWYHPLQKREEQISKPDRGFCNPTPLQPTLASKHHHAVLWSIIQTGGTGRHWKLVATQKKRSSRAVLRLHWR